MHKVEYNAYIELIVSFQENAYENCVWCQVIQEYASIFGVAQKQLL